MILTPFGPKIYHGKIDEEVRLDLLRYAFDAEPSQDASGILAGQLEEQFYIYPSKRDLDERECNLANQLVIKNMLVRKRVNDSIIYKPQAKAQYC